MAYLTLKVDDKGRVHLPKELREELGIQDRVVVEKHRDSLELKGKPSIDEALSYLTSIGIRTKKTPVELKREAEKSWGDSV